MPVKAPLTPPVTASTDPPICVLRSAERDVESRVDRGDGEDRRGPEALVERAHDRALGAEPDHVGADDRGDDADAADQQRQDHQRHQQRRSAERERDRHHGDADGHDIGLEQIGGHSGAVADIVADVVRDHRRVAGIVLGNSGLDLADEVGADVGGLGEDAAAETGEDRNERGAEGECGKRGDDRAVVRLITTGAGQVPEQHRDREQREAGDEQAGDAPARKAVVRPLCRLLRAASAVRTLARTEMFMPMKPAAPDRIAPITKATADSAPRKMPMMTATMTPTMAIVVYWRFR